MCLSFTIILYYFCNQIFIKHLKENNPRSEKYPRIKYPEKMPSVEIKEKNERV